MTEHEKNLPSVTTTQAMAVMSEQRDSLVSRGLVAIQNGNRLALTKNNDNLYHQARMEFDKAKVMLDNSDGKEWSVKENPAFFSAFKIFQQLASQNYGKAYYPLSIFYDVCQDIEDQASAKHFAKLAFDWCYANRANQDASLWCDLGGIYFRGLGVEQNYEQAAYWFRKAAEQGFAEAQWPLGNMYIGGLGVEQNDEQAAYWIRKAAEQDFAEAQIWLGRMYLNGYGVEQNYEQAVHLFRKAAEKGNYEAKKALGELGIG